MSSVCSRLAGTIFFVSLLAACRPASPARPVVGVAYPAWSRLYVELAESALVREWGDTALLPRFVVDSNEPNERLERVVEWTQLLVQTPGVAAVVGPSSSRSALAVAPMVNRAAIPQVVPSSTSRLLHQAGPWTFRLVPDDSAEGEFLVHQVLARPGLRRALIVYTNDEYGQGIRLGVREALMRKGMHPTAEIPVAQDSDFELLLRAELRSRRPDVIIAAIRTIEMIPLAMGLKSLGSRAPVFAADGAFWPLAFHQRVGTVPFEVHAVAFWLPSEADSVGREFMVRFQQRTERPARPEDAFAYDALMVAANAVRAGKGDPQATRRWLLSLGATEPPYQGATGPIAFVAGFPRPMYLGRFEAGGVVRSELP